MGQCQAMASLKVTLSISEYCYYCKDEQVNGQARPGWTLMVETCRINIFTVREVEEHYPEEIGLGFANSLLWGNQPNTWTSSFHHRA